MKVTPSSNGVRPLAPSSTGSVRGAGGGKAAPSSAGASSTDAARLSALEAQFSQADFNVGKVNEITAAVAAGSYKVNAGVVADKLIASAASLARAKN